jgi:hypothetical protein
MMLEATEGIFNCLGGTQVITLAALARYAAQHPEARTVISALEQHIRHTARTLAKQSK